MSRAPRRREPYRDSWADAARENSRLTRRVAELEGDLAELKRHLYRLLEEREVAGRELAEGRLSGRSAGPPPHGAES